MFQADIPVQGVGEIAHTLAPPGDAGLNASVGLSGGLATPLARVVPAAAAAPARSGITAAVSTISATADAAKAAAMVPLGGARGSAAAAADSAPAGTGARDVIASPALAARSAAHAAAEGVEGLASAALHTAEAVAGAVAHDVGAALHGLAHGVAAAAHGVAGAASHLVPHGHLPALPYSLTEVSLRAAGADVAEAVEASHELRAAREELRHEADYGKGAFELDRVAAMPAANARSASAAPDPFTEPPVHSEQEDKELQDVQPAQDPTYGGPPVPAPNTPPFHHSTEYARRHRGGGDKGVTQGEGGGAGGGPEHLPGVLPAHVPTWGGPPTPNDPASAVEVVDHPRSLSPAPRLPVQSLDLVSSSPRLDPLDPPHSHHAHSHNPLTAIRELVSHHHHHQDHHDQQQHEHQQHGGGRHQEQQQQQLQGAAGGADAAEDDVMVAEQAAAEAHEAHEFTHAPVTAAASLDAITSAADVPEGVASPPHSTHTLHLPHLHLPLISGHGHSATSSTDQQQRRGDTPHAISKL